MFKLPSSLQPPVSRLLYVAPAVLFSWFAILSLFATNIHGTTFQQVILPLIGTTAIVLVLQILLVVLTKRWTLAGLVSLAIVITFFSFDALFVTAQQWFDADQSWLLIWLTYIALAIILIIIASKKPSWPSTDLIKLLSAIGLVLVIGPLLQIIPSLFEGSQAHQQALQATQQLPQPANPQPPASSLPDIYYIVLDRYAATKTQADYYNHDNQQLVDYLAAKQFYTATESRTNYPKTLFSLSSSLNLDYLQNLVDTQAEGVSDTNTASVLLRNHKTGQMLQQLGYTYYHIGNYYELASNPQVADVNLMPNWSNFITTSSFTRQLLETTYYPSLASSLTNYPLGMGFDQHYRWADFGQQQILATTEKSGPKFVMAHLLMPHDPYVYDANCQLLQQPLQRWEITTDDYVDQVDCANHRLMQAIDAILAKSQKPPIIIVQSDEGPEAMVSPTGHHWKFSGATDIAINERTQILNAYYFPDQDYSQLYNTISPVNSFRTIFRQYFGYDLANLPDTTYLWPDKDHLFEFYQSPLTTNP